MSSSKTINATAASLLGFLHSGPMTGWELDAAVEGSIAYFWNVTRSQVYRELRTLSELGLVEAGATGPRERRPYELTDAGRQAFSAWIVQKPGPPIIRMPLLLTVFFGGHLPPGRLAEVVAEELKAGREALQEYRNLKGAVQDPYAAQVLQFGIEYQQTLLAWLSDLAESPEAADPHGGGPKTGNP